MLTPEQMAAREGKLTASRVACLMTGDETKVFNLWREMIGDPDFVAEDLSGIWAIQLGSVTESLNLDWYTRKTGRKLSRAGEVVIHPINDWAACTLDGFDEQIPCPVECKHVGGFEPRSRICERYFPQCVWQMAITNTRQCALSIIEGAKEPVIEIIKWDQGYADELWSRAEAFMDCVRHLVPPVVLPPVNTPVVATVEYDFAGRNEFASEAVVWLENYRYAKKALSAEKALKAMVPADAKRVYGHSVEIIRDKAGRLSLREQKS